MEVFPSIGDQRSWTDRLEEVQVVRAEFSWPTPLALARSCSTGN